MIVEMRMLGRANAWFDDGATALLAALDGGIALRASGGIRVPIEHGAIFEERLSARTSPKSSTGATLRFRSPVLVRHKHMLVSDPRAILRGIVRRVASLARWQAIRLNEDWQRLEAAIDGLEIDDNDLVAYRWARFSLRSGNTPIPAAGWLGALRIRGDLERLAPYLILGETMNAGAQASLGLGWYELALV
ncbi:MAG: CRISPR system precrRNA processing endoribonuclease RAMP protein Cas6 [Beijerinckiaceae bacterium]|nr:CRISPR system precrRNA processing endoribonuclease RAMP protein Cas6 [Beijerinckiaceae bacterium]